MSASSAQSADSAPLAEICMSRNQTVITYQDIAQRMVAAAQKDAAADTRWPQARKRLRKGAAAATPVVTDATAHQQRAPEPTTRERCTIIWVRGGPSKQQGEHVIMSEEEQELHTEPLALKGEQMAATLSMDPAEHYYVHELSATNDLDRKGFEQLVMQLVLTRRMDQLVISDREQVCPIASWPLFEWLCHKHDVAITLVPDAPASTARSPS